MWDTGGLVPPRQGLHVQTEQECYNDGERS